VLKTLGKEARAAIPALIDALKTQSVDVRREAALALGSVTKGTEDGVLALIGALSDEDIEVRSNAADALAEIGTKAKQAVPEPLLLLRKDQSIARGKAIIALASTGKDSEEVISALIQELKGGDARNAALSLGRIGRPAKAAIPLLLQTFKNDNQEIRLYSLKALVRIDRNEPEVLAALNSALEDPNPVVRHWATMEAQRAR